MKRQVTTNENITTNFYNREPRGLKSLICIVIITQITRHKL